MIIQTVALYINTEQTTNSLIITNNLVSKLFCVLQHKYRSADWLICPLLMTNAHYTGLLDYLTDNTVKYGENIPTLCSCILMWWLAEYMSLTLHCKLHWVNTFPHTEATTRESSPPIVHVYTVAVTVQHNQLHCTEVQSVHKDIAYSVTIWTILGTFAIVVQLVKSNYPFNK